MSKRPAITPKMKVDALLHRVFLQFGEYLKCTISGEPMQPGDRIQFDHTHCVALDGPNVYDNLRPVLVKPHQKKTTADLRMIKKTRPGHTERFVVDKLPEWLKEKIDEALTPPEPKRKPGWRHGKREWPSRPIPVRSFQRKDRQ